MTKYVIIGHGPAGASAVDRILALDRQAEVTVFSDEPVPYYYRPRLPEYLAGEVEMNRFTLRSEDWCAEHGVDLRLGTRVADVDGSAQAVIDGEGGRTTYDKLLIAAGASCFVPPVPGSLIEGVFTLRTKEDADRLADWAGRSKRAVLIGGGLLGLEAGFGLTKLGLRVEVVEMFDRLLPRQTDQAAAEVLQGRMEKLGFAFHLGVQAQEITGQDKVAGLRLVDGTEIPADLILFSAGVRPKLELARMLGLEMDKGIIVDDRMQTSREGVWAAGDVTQHQNRLYGIWPAALEQGRIAGADMAGAEAEFKGVTVFNSLKVAGVDLTAAGELEAGPDREAIVFRAEDRYRKIILDRGRIVGFIFVGLTEGIKECRQALESGRDFSALAGAMAEEGFDFSKLN